jgi:hypothetical protein
MYICLCVCSGIIFPWMIYFHFPLLLDCIRKSISRQKCGILPKVPKYLRKHVCSRLAVARLRVHDSYPRKSTMRNCLLLGNGSVTTGISTAKIDRKGYRRKATESFERFHDKSSRCTRATPGNQLVTNKSGYKIQKPQTVWRVTR